MSRLFNCMCRQGNVLKIHMLILHPYAEILLRIFRLQEVQETFFRGSYDFLLKLSYALIYFVQTCVEVASPLIISDQ